MIVAFEDLVDEAAFGIPVFGKGCLGKVVGETSDQSLESVDGRFVLGEDGWQIVSKIWHLERKTSA